MAGLRRHGTHGRRRANRSGWTRHIFSKAPIGGLALLLVGTIGLAEVGFRQPTGVYSATVVRTHGYRVRHHRYIYNSIVELESGGLVRLREVPDLEPGTRVLAEESVSPIFRIKRYTLVSEPELSSP